jgi:hypothetical protein
VQQDDVVHIIRSHVVRGCNATRAARDLSVVPGLCGIVAVLNGAAERAHWLQQLRAYANIYMPDCLSEIVPTARYGSASESALSARCDIEAYSKIEYVIGLQTFLTEEQEKELALGNNDFSFIFSSRRRSVALLLGPARFVNHGCDANARLAALGYNGIKIMAIKTIELSSDVHLAPRKAGFMGNDALPTSKALSVREMHVSPFFPKSLARKANVRICALTDERMRKK